MKVNIPVTNSGLFINRTEFSTLMSTLRPAEDILTQIHFDHLYSTPGRCCKAENEMNSKSMAVYGNTEKNAVPSCSWDKRSVSNRKVHYNEGCQNYSNVTEFVSLENEADGDMNSLNADSIQQVFQNMINLTALTPMTDATTEQNNCKTDLINSSRTSTPNICRNFSSSSTSLTKFHRINNIKVVNSLLDTQQSDDFLQRLDMSKQIENPKTKNENPKEDNSSHSKEDSCNDTSNCGLKKKVKQRSKDNNTSNNVSKTGEAEDSPYGPKAVDEKEWKSIARCLEAEREMNTLLQHAAELLVRRWSEYLSMTTEQIRRFEVGNAKELGLVEEVVEMLEDNDRYVWELIENLQFH